MNILKQFGSVKDFILLNSGAMLGACSIFFFLVPSHVAIGGVAGLSIILHNFIPLNISTITLIQNVVFLIIGFLIIGPEFGAKTLYISIVAPIYQRVLEVWFPNQQSIMGDAFLDLICFIIVGGGSMALLFNINASSGGLDIVSKILNKFFHIEIGRASSIVGTLVALSSIFVYDQKTVVLSLLGTYAVGMAVDYFIFGMDGKKRVCVVSKDDEAIQDVQDYILKNLGTTTTLYDSLDVSDNKHNKELLTMVNKNEYSKLVDFIMKMDTEVFVTVYDIKQVMFHNKSK